ncbi:MAG: hypothetical protein JO247_00755 [Chloroflexi bacterium]|nr:hypothetical protein [Chloroflexota bacterium]
MPWVLVAGAIGLILAAAAFFTLYLPAHGSSNQATVGDMKLWLHARPHTGAAPDGMRLVDLDLTLGGAVDQLAGVDFLADMPTMGHDPATIQSVQQLAPDHYIGVAALDMGGLWRVQVQLRQIDGSVQRAAFDVRI